MKMRLLCVIGLTLAITLLGSCIPTSKITAETPKPTDNALPVSALPSPSIFEAEKPTVSVDTSFTPAPSASILLTFYEAQEICGTWLEKHADVPSDAFHEMVYDVDEIPPPTYYLFDVPYYEFFVSSSRDEASGFSHEILVQAETGELLSLHELWSDEKLQTATVELLDEWYSSGSATYAPARLTADEAVVIYDAWLSEHSDNPEDSVEYSLDKQSNCTYVLFGEQYYRFYAKDTQKYWYNVLVHMETGELLFMYIDDGMFGGTTILPLDDWY